MWGREAKAATDLAPISPQITQRGLQPWGGQKSKEWVKGFEMRLWDLKAPCFFVQEIMCRFSSRQRDNPV